MHERFERQWEEKWQPHSNGGMFPYPEEYYLLQRKESYEERKRWKGNLEHWEHDGFGYIVTLQQDTGRGVWDLSRISLADYCAISYTFWTNEQMEDRIRREGWRPFEQMSLGI